MSETGKMIEPRSFEEYCAKFRENQKISGFGADTTIYIPCAFCGEPDFMVHRIIDAVNAYEAGAICKHCGRGARGIITRSRGSVSVEFVQTCGRDAPSWLPPIRRVAY